MHSLPRRHRPRPRRRPLVGRGKHHRVDPVEPGDLVDQRRGDAPHRRPDQADARVLHAAPLAGAAVDHHRLAVLEEDVPVALRRRGRRSPRRLAPRLGHVEEGLDAGVDAGVGGVAVELQRQERLGVVDPPVEVEDEGVGRAGEVGDVAGEEVAPLLHQHRPLEILLPVVPVHVGRDGLVGERQEVEGDDAPAAGHELAGDAHVGGGREGVVGTAEEDDGRPAGGLGLGQRLAPQAPPLAIAGGLPLHRQRPGLAPVLAGAAQLQGHLLHGLETRLEPGGEVEHRPQQARVVDGEGGAQGVGEPLHDGAEAGVHVLLVGRHGLQVRQEDEVGLDRLLQERAQLAVGQLGGVAEGGLAACHPLLRHLGGELDAHAQRGEEVGVERPQGVDGEGLGHPHQHAAPGQDVGLGRVGLEVELAPHLDPVLHLAGGQRHLAAQVRELVAAPAEVVARLPHLHDPDGAEVLAGAAAVLLLRADRPGGELAERERRCLDGAVLEPGQPHERHAVGAHQLGIGRDHHRLAEELREGQGHGRVLGHPALQHDAAADGAAADHAVQVVGDDGERQAGHDVAPGRSLRDGLADVGVDEGRAVLAELERRGGLHRDGADLLGVGDVEVPGGRLLQERAGPGAAGLVHGVVDRDVVAQRDVLGVLPADLEDGVDGRIERRGAGGVGHDLVVDGAGAAEDAQQLARRAGGGGQHDLHGLLAADLVGELAHHLGEAAAQRRHRIPQGAAVVAGHHLPAGGVDQRHLGGGRAPVDAEHVAGPGARPAAA